LNVHQFTCIDGHWTVMSMDVAITKLPFVTKSTLAN